MSQQRLDIFTRKVSDEEQSYKRRISELEHRIRQERKIIAERNETLTRHMQAQQRHRVGYGEKELTQQYIDKVLQPNRQHVKKLEKELIELKRETGAVQKAGSRQSDMFN